MASPSIASATDRAPLGWRAVVRLLAMVGVLLFLIPPHLLYRLVGRPSPMVMAFLNAIGWIAGLRVRTTGMRRRRDVLFASNHVSWLDILALGGAARSAFVAKAEVEKVPLVGWLADQNNSVYVDREARREVHHQAHTLRGELERGHPVTLFPEGTTGPGTSLLPFRASLFQAVAPPPPGVCIQPVLLDYGPGAESIAWLGSEHGVNNFKRILSRRGTIALAIHYLEPLPQAVTHDRKAIANAVRDAIAAEMAKVGLG
jgi:1-acyl-sn-glycerol-3-phosphate acyltransferase